LFLAAGNVWMQECIETGNELLGSGQLQQAAEVYSQINLNQFINLNKNLIFQLCNNLAVCLLNLGKAAEALEVFLSPHLVSSLEDDTNSSLSLKRRSDTALNKAIILKSLNRPEEALAEFDTCLSYQPDNLTAICGKSEILSSTGRFEEAIQVASNAIEVNPLSENTTFDVSKVSQILSLWVARGFAYIKLNSFADAINDFNFAINTVSRVPGISPTETSVKEAGRLRNICLGYYADHLLGTGEIEKAIVIYDEAIEITGGPESGSVNVLFNRAYAHYQLATGSPEHLEKAIEGFQLVVKKDPNHFQGQTGLGQALLNKADAMAAATGSNYFLIFSPVTF
jgi:tetratricopeptide (TPR) repeat protein